MSISRHDDYSLEKKKGGKFTEYITAQLTLELYVSWAEFLKKEKISLRAILQVLLCIQCLTKFISRFKKYILCILVGLLSLLRQHPCSQTNLLSSLFFHIHVFS